MNRGPFHFTFILLLLSGLFLAPFTEAKASDYQVSFKDSIRLDEHARLLSGIFIVTNTSTGTLKLRTALKIPNGWKPISANSTSLIELHAGESKAVPYSLLKNSRVQSGWDSLALVLTGNSQAGTSIHYLKVAVPERAGYTLKQIDEARNFPGAIPDTVLISALLQNTGNVGDTFMISCTSAALERPYHTTFYLAAGSDTNLNLPCRVKASMAAVLSSENITLKLSCTRNPISKYLNYSIATPRSVVRQNDVTHEVLPLNIGGGLLAIGNNTTYFGQFSGLIKTGNHSVIFSYRSKDLGSQAYSYQPHVFYVGYTYKRLRIDLGQIQNPHNFFTTGRGVSVNYYSKKGAGFTIAAMKHIEIPTFTLNRSDNIYGQVHYNIRKIRIAHILESNFDRYFKVNGYLLSNEIGLIKTKRTRLDLFFGAGLEERLQNIPGVARTVSGLSGGYNFVSNYRSWMLTSVANINSTNFPGIYRGYKNHQHDLVYNFKKSYAGVFYYSNAVERNTLRDTLYNTDYLTSNNSRYGVQFGYLSGKTRINIKAGALQSKGLLNMLNDAAFFDVSLNAKIGRGGVVSFSSANAFKRRKDTTLAYVTTTYGTIGGRIWSISGAYNRLPGFGENGAITSFTETVNGGPAINFAFFRNKLAGSIRYNIAKTMNEKQIRHGIGGQITLAAGKKSNLTFNVNGFYPLTALTTAPLPITETRYGSFTMNKKINVPFKRLKLYNITIILYSDDNHNGVQDEQEELLQQAAIRIENKMLLTDEKGSCRYLNAKPGTYTIDLNSVVSGSLIPSNGNQQIITLTENMVVSIPFQKGKKLAGNLAIDLDSLSGTSLTPGNFKIIIVDTAGKSYSTLTNRNGDFYIYLPEGKYTVSLNPEAFAASDFKPERINQSISLFGSEAGFLQFNVKQKRRKIRFLETIKPSGSGH